MGGNNDVLSDTCNSEFGSLNQAAGPDTFSYSSGALGGPVGVIVPEVEGDGGDETRHS